MVDGLRLHMDLIRILKNPNFDEAVKDVGNRLNAEIGKERCGEMEELKVGDRVKIVDDSPLARRIFKMEMKIRSMSPYMLSFFGDDGYIVEMSWEPGDSIWPIARVYGPYGRTSWPIVLLEKLPADECENIHHVSGVSSCEGLIKSMEAVAKVETPKPGVAEIVFDHVVRDGKCALQIAEINGVQSWKDLPEDYMKSGSAMWGTSRNRLNIDDGEYDTIFRVGKILTEEEAEKLVKRMRACGKRLHDINVTARAKADEERLARWKAKGRKVVRI